MSTHSDPDRSNEAKLTDFEKSLGSIRPVSRVGRDQILYRAGQQQAMAQMKARSQNDNRAYWPAIAACLAVVVIAQGGLLLSQSPNQVRVVYVEAPRQSPEATELPDSTHPATADSDRATSFVHPDRTAVERLGWQLMQDGLDALPATPITALDPPENPLTPGQTLEIHMNKRAHLGDAL